MSLIIYQKDSIAGVWMDFKYASVLGSCSAIKFSSGKQNFYWYEEIILCFCGIDFTELPRKGCNTALFYMELYYNFQNNISKKSRYQNVSN